ncbi:hypothetical protein [Bifidobacterium sp. ESL0745]|uniref:hypothetical protein n=1 Tax=Bifidobacterium sp. ESL0745 TaxID=2983226 RepID=UPI0023F69161|nr:hypothetical protein [Bifidobacterium sp. ESL0745]MDF7665485.1 hypothetical protein [Bifidobacterium sp. ESL0745]
MLLKMKGPSPTKDLFDQNLRNRAFYHPRHLSCLNSKHQKTRMNQQVQLVSKMETSDSEMKNPVEVRIVKD